MGSEPEPTLISFGPTGCVSFPMKQFTWPVVLSSVASEPMPQSMLSSGRSLRECRRPEERWVATAVLLLILSCGIGWGEDNPGRKILTEWSELKGVEGFEDLEGIDDPAALDDLESIEDLEELEKLIGLEGLDLDLRMPTWDHEATLSGSIGYNDNPLLQPAGQDPERRRRSGGRCTR